MLTKYQTPPHPHALILIGAPGHNAAGEPIATATVYLEHALPDLQPGEVVIKNWSENEGMHEALEAAGIIGPVLRRLLPTFEPREQTPATIHKLLAWDINETRKGTGLAIPT